VYYFVHGEKNVLRIYAHQLSFYGTSLKNHGASDSLSEFLREAVPVGTFSCVLSVYTSLKNHGASDSLSEFLREAVPFFILQ
jgi:hypothetical protein